MALILSIDTSTEIASISLASQGKLIGHSINNNQKDHASFLHPAIKTLLEEYNFNPAQLNAVAVVAGPGSYTGLKVSMASAKGLCYALNIPMISLNGLELLALSAMPDDSNDSLFCPMIDARRMEVYTALYNNSLNELISPCAMILDNNSFADFLTSQRIVFFGSGAGKFKEIAPHKSAIFTQVAISPNVTSMQAFEHYSNKRFVHVSTAEPLYLKEFYSTADPVKPGINVKEIVSNIDYYHVKKASLILKALNHKLRQQIVKVIAADDNQTVTEIYIKLRIDQSVASQHLGILRTAGIVKTRREGKFIYYSVDAEKLESVTLFVKDLLS